MVVDLNAYTVGGVVNEAEKLMEIVPLGEKLEVEAFVGNQGIGYVHAGQSAEVKIHTFPFTRYGVIAARVEAVARDATVDEKLGLIYRTTLSLEESTIMVDGMETPLLPGMCARRTCGKGSAAAMDISIGRCRSRSAFDRNAQFPHRRPLVRSAGCQGGSSRSAIGLERFAG
jgi:hypothetical protein